MQVFQGIWVQQSKSYKENKAAVLKQYEGHIETDEFKNSYIRLEQHSYRQEAQKLMVLFIFVIVNFVVSITVRIHVLSPMYNPLFSFIIIIVVTYCSIYCRKELKTVAYKHMLCSLAPRIAVSVATMEF